MKYLIWSAIIIVVCGVANVYASNATANAGHHGGGNNGALGAAAGAHSNGQASAGSSADSRSGGVGDCDMAHYVLCSQGSN